MTVRTKYREDRGARMHNAKKACVHATCGNQFSGTTIFTARNATTAYTPMHLVIHVIRPRRISHRERTNISMREVVERKEKERNERSTRADDGS